MANPIPNNTNAISNTLNTLKDETSILVINNEGSISHQTELPSYAALVKAVQEQFVSSRLSQQKTNQYLLANMVSTWANSIKVKRIHVNYEETRNKLLKGEEKIRIQDKEIHSLKDKVKELNNTVVVTQEHANSIQKAQEKTKKELLNSLERYNIAVQEHQDRLNKQAAIIGRLEHRARLKDTFLDGFCVLLSVFVSNRVVVTTPISFISTTSVSVLNIPKRILFSKNISPIHRKLLIRWFTSIGKSFVVIWLFIKLRKYLISMGIHGQSKIRNYAELIGSISNPEIAKSLEYLLDYSQYSFSKLGELTKFIGINLPRVDFDVFSKNLNP